MWIPIPTPSSICLGKTPVRLPSKDLRCTSMVIFYWLYFCRGPVWVYVLERRRAIEVWNTVMGDPDPQIAREQSPSSLRALYGITREQNAVMGSPDVEIAEIQIASLFVSSPPFPASNLPEEYPVSLRSVSSTLPSHRVPTSTSGHSAAGSSATNGTQQRGTPFKAREIPLSHDSPTIVPRTTRAADLRAGVTPPKAERSPGPRTPPSKEALQKMFADVPGHKRTSVIAVASTAPPVMAPRMTRAASLRISGAPPPRPVRPRPIITLAQAKVKAEEEARAAAVLKEAQARTFDGVPGHKRRESFSVASTKPPTVSPRQNRAAALRTSKDTPPPTSYQCALPLPSVIATMNFNLFFFFWQSGHQSPCHVPHCRSPLLLLLPLTHPHPHLPLILARRQHKAI